MEFLFQHYLIGLLAVANCISAIPLFLSITQGTSRHNHLKLCLIASFTALITMLVSMLLGSAILHFFGITIDAFRIAGGVVLFITGIGMINAKPAIQSESESSAKPYHEMLLTIIIPITIPMTTGAGCISTVIVFAGTAKGLIPMLSLGAAIVSISLLTYFSLRYSRYIQKWLGNIGMNVLTKIFGLITLAIGIQFMLTGISDTFPHLIK